MLRRLQAKGRLKPGEMNKTEARYAEYLAELQRLGSVQWFVFESVKLKIADGRCWYTPDFVVMNRDGFIELHEVKGARVIFEDDAKVKVKVAARKFPFLMIVAYPKRGGGWEWEEF